MSRPIYALEVLGALAEQNRQRGGWLSVDKITDARAAVAELIEAANLARSILALHDERCQRLDAALANVRGAA